MNVNVKFLGKTSSGLGAKYIILVDPAKEAATIKEAQEAGIELNANVGKLGFISSTHLHLTPKIGDEATVVLKSFKQGARTVNWFDGIDKDAQKAFVNGARYAQSAIEAASYVTALDNAGINFEHAEAFARFQNLQLMSKKLNAEIAALAKA